jgi:hypothetical protein
LRRSKNPAAEQPFAVFGEGGGMKRVELYFQVRHAVRIEGLSGRAAILLEDKYNFDNIYKAFSVWAAFLIALIVSAIFTKVYEEPAREYLSKKLRQLEQFSVICRYPTDNDPS